MNKHGFTLVELVIVIVILGILASVAIPRFINLTAEAQAAATKGSLGGVRSGIAIFYASSSLDGTPNWPTDAELTGGTVMAQDIPTNPYTSPQINTVRAAATARGLVSGTEAWAYNSTSGQFWANTTNASSNAW